MLWSKYNDASTVLRVGHEMREIKEHVCREADGNE